jgi:uncharacterized protein YdeI (YjbR/CyaY-like superfamily)
MVEHPRIPIESVEDWRRWLQAHADSHGSVWLVTWKKGLGPHVPYGDLVDEALCFGWIDSLPRRLDDKRTMLLMSPRRAGRGWSAVNKGKITRLVGEGRMTDRGLEAIARAKRDGSWTLLDRASALIVSDDLAAALDRHDARANFDAFPPSTRRGILEWIDQARRSETRHRRIEATAAAAARNERIGQWRR